MLQETGFPFGLPTKLAWFNHRNHDQMLIQKILLTLTFRMGSYSYVLWPSLRGYGADHNHVMCV